MAQLMHFYGGLSPADFKDLTAGELGALQTVRDAWYEAQAKAAAQT